MKKSFLSSQLSLPVIAFLQSLGLISYCTLLGTLMFNAEHFFGKVDTVYAPILFLTLFIVSALICSLIGLGYPIYLALEKKDIKSALKNIVFITFWLLLSLIAIFYIILS